MRITHPFATIQGSFEDDLHRGPISLSADHFGSSFQAPQRVRMTGDEPPTHNGLQEPTQPGGKLNAQLNVVRDEVESMRVI